MDIKNFINENGILQIPEDNIDSIYIWVRVTRTQEALMSSKVYHKWMKHSFEIEASKVISVLRESYPLVTLDSYQLSDFITFNANKSSIFSGKRRCFVHSKDNDLILSLLCYIAHTMNLYNPVEADLFRMITDRVNDPDLINKWLTTDLLLLSANGVLPEHKYKQSTLTTLFIDRCKDAYCTLVHTFNANDFLFDNNQHLIDTSSRRGIVDLNPLIKVWKDRRSYDYKKLMSTWFSMLANKDVLVYSKSEPKTTLRRAEGLY